MSDDVLERLMEKTQFSNISKVNDTYVITFDTHNRSLVKGMLPTNNGFRLTHEEFNDIPLAFFATLHDDELNLDSVHEYWTLDGKLHRDGDLPAYVCLYESGTFKRFWYQHGVCTRAGGPAAEEGAVGEEHVTPINADRTKYTYRSIVQTWMKPELVPWFTTDTVKGRDALEGPFEVCMKNAVIYRDAAGVIMSHGDECAISCDELIMSWEAPPTKRLYPMKLHATSFAEHRPGGLISGRVAATLDVFWCEEYQHYSKPAYSNWLYLNMFQNLNLFEGEFFSNSADEFITFSEFEKIKSK